MSENADNRQEKHWLVKSSTRILGPFAAEEVAQLLTRKHISVIDEIRPPDDRWKYIREQPLFEDIVRALREEQDNAPDNTQTSTQTSTSTSTSASFVGTSLTRTDKIDLTGVTLTPTPPAHVTPAPLAKSDVDVGDAVKDLTSVKETTLGSRPSAGSYGHTRDRAVRNRFSRMQKLARGAVLGIGLMALLVVAMVQLRKSLRREEGYENLIASALRYRSMNVYDKSLSYYRKATQLRDPSPEVQMQMAPVLIVLDRQTAQGRRMLERALQAEGRSRAQIIDASLGIAMSYVLEGNLREAEETLHKVLVIEPQNFSARLNLALLALRKGDARDAGRQLAELAPRHPSHPLLLLARAIALLDITENRENAARFLVAEIRNSLNESRQLRRELLMASLLLMPPDDPAVPPLISEFLSQVSTASVDYVRDLRLDWRVADWEFIERHCRAFGERAGSLPRVKAVRAVCLMEAGSESEARRALAEALLENPRDPMTLFTQANLLYRSGLRNEAYAVLRRPELAGLPARDLLIGKISLDQGDLATAQNSFRAVLTHGLDLSALTGLATALRKQGSPEANGLIRDGLSHEPDYLPLIELREGIEEAQ